MIDDTGSVEGIYALHTAQRGDLVRSLKDRATQLLTKYKSGAPVTQYLKIRDGVKKTFF